MPRRRAKPITRRLAIIAILLIVLLPLIAFGISNLYLNTPKGRKHIASHIAAVTGMESSVQGASWSPWNGVTVYGIEVSQPPLLREEFGFPLLRVQSVHCVPVWRKLARKTLQIRRLDLIKPELSVPIELLSHIPRTTPPELAANAVPPSPHTIPPALVQNGRPAAAGHLPTTIPSQAPHQLAQPDRTKPTVRKPSPAAQTPATKTAPTVSVNFTDGSFTLLSSFTKEPLYHVASASGSIPIAGKPKTSAIILRQVSALGTIIAAETKIPVGWHSPFLDFGPCDFNRFETMGNLSCRLLLTPGIPFFVAGNIPEQKNLSFELPGALKTKVGVLAAQGGLKGLLQNPSTWQGKAVARSSDIRAEHAAGKTEFESGQALVFFGNGTLSCVDARLVGETTSILANGALLTDGRCASNARIVSNPENLASISRHTQQGSGQAHLTPLSTPQRAALDLQLFGRLGEIYFKPNPASAPVSLSGH